MPVCAAGESDLLQLSFSDDGTTMRAFLKQEANEKTEVVIGNDTIAAEVQNQDVQIRTTFLIDNSTSMPYDARDGLKTKILDYVSSMPNTEMVKIAKFDTETTMLSDEYSRDRSFIEYSLEKVDFNGQASLVYDALLQTIESEDHNADIYYRTVLLTDGVDSIAGTSFDFLRTEIDENSRCHVDVIQVSKDSKEEVNLKGIAELGSNTFMLYQADGNFDSLKPGSVSMVKVPMTNAIMTGEYRGVTIKNGGTNLVLGSVLFPQAELAEPETAAPTQAPTQAPTEKPTKAETQATTPVKEEGPEMNWTLILIITGICLLLAAVAAFITIRLVFFKKKCVVEVEIRKQSATDKKGCGKFTWTFKKTESFHVGRVPRPMDGSVALPENQFVIVEEENKASIGRNAFKLSYDPKVKMLLITNVAKGAVVYLNTTDRPLTAGGGHEYLKVGTKILIGAYTEIEVRNIKLP